LPIPLVTGTLFAGMVFVMARRSLVELKRE
jgi:hypothetical protein